MCDAEQRLRSVSQLDLTAVSESRNACSRQAGERHDRIVRSAKSAERADQRGAACRGHMISVPEECYEVSLRNTWRRVTGRYAASHVMIPRS